MATTTKTQGQLMDWTLLDETVGVETNVLNAGEGINTNLVTVVNIVMAHIDANANTGSAGWKLFGRVSGTDEGWRFIVEATATLTTANAQIVAAASGSGQANPERIEVAATANFDGIGDVVFLKDVGTLANSCLVTIKDFVTNDYVVSMDDLVNAYDNADYLYDVVDEWPISIPLPYDECKVLFYNTDADSEFACRVDYALVTAIG